MQAQLLSSHSSLFRETHYSYAALHGCQQRISVFLDALSDVCLCTCVVHSIHKWQVLKELPDGCVLRGRLPRLMIMKN